jgi:hypothetical protein
MGQSRYAKSQTVAGTSRNPRAHYATWSDPIASNPLGPDILDGVQCVIHILSLGERLDTLAFKYYGDSDYWWVIALANRIMDPFSLVPGQQLRIPSDVKSILDKVTG